MRCTINITASIKNEQSNDFYPQVNMVDANGEPIVNKIKSGRPVPLKFEVFDEKGVELTRTGTDVISSFKSA
jgi:hypothetical protein